MRPRAIATTRSTPALLRRDQLATDQLSERLERAARGVVRQGTAGNGERLTERGTRRVEPRELTHLLEALRTIEGAHVAGARSVHEELEADSATGWRRIGGVTGHLPVEVEQAAEITDVGVVADQHRE